MSRYLKENGNLIPLEKYNADNGLSTTSENAVQNKVITQEILETKADIESGLSGKSGRFEIIDVNLTNASSVTVASGKDGNIPLTANKTVPSNSVLLSVYYVNSGSTAFMVRLFNQGALYIRNVTSASVTIPANSAVIGAKYLHWL